MKTLVSFLVVSVFLSLSAFAGDKPVLSCRVTQLVNDSYFEESLDTRENNLIELRTSVSRGMTIDVGSSQYSEKDGDKIESSRTPIGRVITFSTKGSDEVFSLALSGPLGREKGQLMVTKGSRKKATVIAKVTCYDDSRDDE
jgi:hypothetical protein